MMFRIDSMISVSPVGDSAIWNANTPHRTSPSSPNLISCSLCTCLACAPPSLPATAGMGARETNRHALDLHNRPNRGCSVLLSQLICALQTPAAERKVEPLNATPSHCCRVEMLRSKNAIIGLLRCAARTHRVPWGARSLVGSCSW